MLALAPAEPLVGLLVTALLVLGYALDSADGQLARLTGGGSLRRGVAGPHGRLGQGGGLPPRGAGHPVPQLRPRPDVAPGAAGLRGRVLGPLLRHDPDRPVRPGPLGRRTGCRRRRPGRLRVSTLLKLPTDYGIFCLAILLLGLHAAVRGGVHLPRGGDGRLHRCSSSASGGATIALDASSRGGAPDADRHDRHPGSAGPLRGLRDLRRGGRPAAGRRRPPGAGVLPAERGAEDDAACRSTSAWS